MADFFGLVASILQLVDTVAKAHHYITDFHDAPKDQQRLLWEIKSLEPLVRKLDNQIRKDQAAGLLSGLREFEESLVLLKGVMERLTKKLDSTGISKLAGRLAWPLWGKEDVNEGLNAIERFKSLLNAWLGMDILNFTQDITSSLQDVAEEQRVDHGYISRSVEHFAQEHRVAHDQTISNLKDLQNEHRIDHKYIAQSVRNVAKNQDSGERDKIIEWFSPLNFFLRQADIFNSREPGTGQWFLEHELFKKWKTGTTKMLWCPGMPGAGKTVLSSIVVEDLRETLENQDTGIAVLYLNHKETEMQSPSNLLAGLWRQLIVEKPISSAVARLYSKHRERRTRPSLEEIHAILGSAVSQYSNAFIIIDALDEYPERQRGILLRCLSSLGSTVNLMLTSRPNINPNHVLNLQTLEIRAAEDDIRLYVDSQILGSFRLSRHIQNRPSLREDIETTIVRRSDGMFLLAKFHIDSLTMKHTVKAIRDALKKMPEDLNSTYDEVMERINRQSEDDRRLALLTLSWITNAKRPLRPSELREALAVEQGTTELDKDNLLDIDTVLAVCAGLIVIAEGDKRIRLIHYTTQKYLDSVQHNIFPHAQTEITMTCITYVSFNIFSQHLRDPMNLFYQNSLLDYAVEYCLIHARGQPEVHIKQVILAFLANCHAWWELWNWKHAQQAKSGTGLGIATAFRLDEICREMIQEGDRGAMLWQAALEGLTDMVRILLENGDNVEADKEGYACALGAAHSLGHINITRLLLDHADVNSQELDVDVTGRLGPALYIASRRGSYDVVHLLLEQGAEVNSIGGQFHTALHVALVEGHNEVARLLIAHGADTSAIFYTAWLEGHSEIIFQLLRIKPYAYNAGGNSLQTPHLTKHEVDPNAPRKYPSAGMDPAGKGAVEIRRRLAEREPTIIRGLAESLHNLGIDLRNVGRHEDAVRVDKEVVEIRRKLAERDPTIMHMEDLAISLHKLGANLSNAGRHEDAVPIKEEAVEIRRGLVVPPDPTTMQHFAQSLQSLAVNLINVGRHEDAVRVGEEAVEILHRVVETDPTAIQDLARYLHTLGIALSKNGFPKDAVPIEEEAVEIRRRLVETDPTAIQDLAHSLHNLGFNLSNVGHYEDALRVEEEAVEIWRRIVETDPTAIQDLAQSLHNLAVSLRNVGRHKDVVRVDKEVVEIYRRLIERDPTVTRDLVESLRNLGIDLRNLGRPEDAVPIKEEAVEICRRLVETDPTAIQDLARSLHSLGFDLTNVGRYEDAVRVGEETAEVWRRVVETEPTAIQYFAKALHNLAVDLSNVGRYEDAVRIEEEAIEIWRRIVETNPTAIQDLATSLYNLAGNFCNAGRHEDVVRVGEEAVGIWRSIVETDPTAIGKLAHSLHTLAVDLSNAGRYENAVRLGEESVEVHRRLVETDPITIQDLAQSLHNLAVNLRNAGRHEDAVRVDEELVEIRRRIVETDPTAIQDLAHSLHNLGFNLSNVGRYEDALRVEEEAVEIWRRIVETDPTTIQDLAQSLHKLGVHLANLGRHEDAVPVDQEAVEIFRVPAGKDPNATEILAICLLGLNRDLRLIGCHKDALPLAEEAVGLCRTLAGDPPTLLAESLKNMGFDLHAARRSDDAVRVLEEAIGIYQELEEPSVTTKLKLANALLALATFQHAAGRVEHASCAYDMGAVIHRKLGETDPDKTANFLHYLAVNFRSIGFHDDALRAEKEAVALYRKLVQTKPAFRVCLAMCLKLLGEDLRTLGREDEAARTDTDVATLKAMPCWKAHRSATGADMSQRLLTMTAGHEIVEEVGVQDEEGEKDPLRAH
ncbi:hypothetical protein DFH09DRAFT_1364040 [Mycena vulgaris]|nr:hypothetical protein DFH09DRAFT_1364040 [Mycena vulgaris]